MKISVLGCGRWGSFIAWYLCNKGYDVANWGIEGSYPYEVLKNEGKNEYVELDKRIDLTSDLEYAVNKSDILIISIPSQEVRGFVKRLIAYDLTNKTFLLCMKGIEVETGKRLSEILIEHGIDKNKIAVWVGPGHIQAFTQGQPSCMVIDSYSKELTTYLADNFRSNLIRFYYGDDIIGSEIGAAAKNVMGIAAGMLDGSGYSTLKGALMARGAREVARLIKVMGGNEMSAYGLCHLGDYEATLFSQFSHNRVFGEQFVKKEKFSKLAEGVATTKAMMNLAKKYGEELPITNAVYEILYNGKEPMDAFSKLFERRTKKEF